VINGGTSGQLEAVGDPDGMDTFVNEAFRLLQKSTAQDDHAGGTVANLVVLRLRELDQQLGNLE